MLFLQASIAAYLLLLMGTYWCTNIIPLGVTGLLPIFYLPMTGLLSLADTCVCYLEVGKTLYRLSFYIVINISSQYILFNESFGLRSSKCHFDLFPSTDIDNHDSMLS